MLTKAIIVKNIDNYSSKIRIPIYHKAKGSANSILDKDLPTAYYCMPPGVKPSFKEGEVVWVDFELDEVDMPVIIGTLCSPKSSSTLSLNAQSLKVDVDAEIPDIENKILQIINTSSIIPASSTYVHTQRIPSDTWEIQHNLKKYPSVTIVDSGDNVQIGEVEYINLNKVIVRFIAQFSGKAYLN